MSGKLTRIIFALAKRAVLSEEELRDNVEAVSGQRSIRALDNRQVNALIVRLRAMVGEDADWVPSRKKSHAYPPKRTPIVEGGRVVRLVSPEQRLFIDWLLNNRIDLGGKDPKRWLATMCHRMFSRPEPHTAREAGLVIGNLRKQAGRQALRGEIPTFEKFMESLPAKG